MGSTEYAGEVMVCGVCPVTATPYPPVGIRFAGIAGGNPSGCWLPTIGNPQLPIGAADNSPANPCGLYLGPELNPINHLLMIGTGGVDGALVGAPLESFVVGELVFDFGGIPLRPPNLSHFGGQVYFPENRVVR